MPASSILYENIIGQTMPMQPLHPVEFDRLMAEAWRLLGDTITRHNYAVYRGEICLTNPLRINLDQFRFSKSQRKLLQQSRNYDIQVGAIVFDDTRERLFTKHTQRYQEFLPANVGVFLGPNAGTQPVLGRELAVLLEGRIVACSYFHIGAATMSGTYCFFDPDLHRLSLGALTMLREIELAQELGLQYYYHGYCYDIPSQFDYKLNFNALEAMNWETGKWHAIPRVPPRQ
jgi:arginine-tRNA-protein transferase